ncbi:MAG: NUDIX domain-containing protein [Patescibacteria group bacterium]|nr:NUDIX domain-containing protein [Patescibacteria group bacterium]
MPLEKSAGAVVFHRRPAGEIEYLLLGQRAGHWGFPKGLIEAGETSEETAKREVKEEAGIENFSLIPGFKQIQKYFFKVKYDYQLERGWKKGEGVFKIVIYFLCQAKTKEVKLSFEHEDYAWLNFKEALDRLTFRGAKEILKKANDYLELKMKNEK